MFLGAKRLILLMYYYLVTIASYKKLEEVTEKELKQAANAFLMYYKRAWIVSIGVEAHGLYRQLHCHMVVGYYKRFYYKQFKSIFGLRIHYKPLELDNIHDQEAILKYVHKYDHDDDYVRDMIFIENYYKYNYGFIDTAVK